MNPAFDSTRCLVKKIERSSLFKNIDFWLNRKEIGNRCETTKNYIIAVIEDPRQQRLFPKDRYILYTILLSLFLSVCLSSPPLLQLIFHQIIVSNHRYVQDTFCDIPQSFLRPKDSQITPVTRSNFAQQRHSEYKHVRLFTAPSGLNRGWKRISEFEPSLPIVETGSLFPASLPRRCIIKAIMPFARKQVYTVYACTQYRAPVRVKSRISMLMRFL